MKGNTLFVFAFYILLDRIQRSMVQSQLVTAGTYYREVATSEESEKVLAADVPVLTQEMFYCSKKAGCGTLGRMRNQKLYQEVSRGVDLTGYDEIIEKNKSGFKDCKELHRWGIIESGAIDISWRNGSAFQAYCNMKTDGGSWLVFQRRNDTTSFYRNWTDYVTGFGDRDGSFWLGLEALHLMTSNKSENVVLRVDITDKDGNKGFAKYQNFVVGSAAEKYKFSYDSYAGNVGDGLARSKGMKFSTPDQDNDISTDNCAIRFRGAWWHERCFDGNLNNGHPHVEHNTSTPEAEGAAMMSWYPWKSQWGTIIYSEMMIKVAEN